jgi:diguanylate cyclase (GGDEF)-like protein
MTATIQDITARKLEEERLRKQALTDQLTGLANRDALLQHLGEAVRHVDGNSGPALLYIDLDRFKVINDLLGHAAGDGLLVAAAERLRRASGDETMIARFGGDEFMLVYPAWRGENEPAASAMRITSAFDRPFRYAGEDFTITASIGIAHCPEDGTSVQQLINHADAAMFEAKRRGRNQWQRFTPQLARALTDRLMIETQLRRALDNNEFHLVFQPQVELAGGRTVGVEALLRWDNRVLGALMPDVFVPHAENTGDIVRIGAWVIREACRQLRAWSDTGLGVMRISVNVSYRQFLSENLVEVVTEALKQHALPGSALELELTERVLIEDAPDTHDTFERLKAQGVQLVIDDFGEGYSALNYLRRLPFDGLKISHEFMQGIPANAADSAICEAMIHMAAALGVVVVAEGVEPADQRAFLLRHGARLAQGYLFSRPLEAGAFERYVRRGIGVT